VREVRSDAKGGLVALPGRALLRIVFHPASGYRSYPGPGSITPMFPALLQVRAAGDFEGYLSFGAGLSQRARFKVVTLTRPYRVVIDVAHESLPPFPGIWNITTWPRFWVLQAAFNEGHQPWLASPLMVVQSWAAGPDQLMTPEMKASQVVCTSCKGNGAIPLAEHAMMLMLMLNRDARRWLRAQGEHRWDH